MKNIYIIIFIILFILDYSPCLCQQKTNVLLLQPQGGVEEPVSKIVQEKINFQNIDTINLSFSPQPNNVIDKIQFLRKQAIIQSRNGNLKEALALHDEALIMSTRINYKIGIIDNTNDIGNIYTLQSNYAWATREYLKALSLSKAIQYKKGIGRSLNDLANMSEVIGEYSDAIQYLQRSLIICKEIKDTNGIGIAQKNLANIFTKQKQYSRAIYYARKANNIFWEAGDTSRYVGGLVNISKILYEVNELDSALYYARKAVSLSHLQGNFLRKCTATMQLGVVYAKKEAFDDAFFHLYQAQWMAQTHGHQETMRQTANQIYLLHKKNNQLDSALFYHELLLFTSNTIWDTEKTRQINSLQLSFNLEERLQQLEVKEKQIQQQNYLTWLLIIFIVSLGFFIGKLYFQQKKLNHQNKVLRLQNTQILTQSEQMAQMNSLKDKLFSIISHDLRSPLKNLQGAIELLNTENALNHEEILAITSSIQQQTENVSVVMENLLQWSLAQMKGQQQWQPISLNLLAATQEAINLLQNIADNKNITIFCSIDPMLEVIADENHLKFIMRNLLGNAIKFTANGGRVLLYSKIENNDIVVKVEDTGVGMTPAQCTKLFNINTHFSTTGTQAEKGTGLGLLLVKDFVEQNGGNISVESEAGKGTIFSFTVKRAVK